MFNNKRLYFYFITIIHLKIFFLNQGSSLRILGLFPSPFKSHSILGYNLMTILADSGHEVVLVSPYNFPTTQTNFRQLQMTNFDAIIPQNNSSNLDIFMDEFGLSHLKDIYDYGILITKLALEDPVITHLKHSNETFDVVITEIFINYAILALADYFKAYSVGLSTIGPTQWVNDLVGNPTAYACIPGFQTGFTNRMSFYERIYNTIFYVTDKIIMNYLHLPEHELLREKYFPETHSLPHLLKNVSLVLMNSHPVVSYSRPLVPNMIEIGGFHVNPPKKLPSDLKQILDDAKDGVIYLSMGSFLISAGFPGEFQRIVLETFKNSKQVLLWKWERDTPPSRSHNMVFRSWFPQQDVLAHPNVKAFITHCGMLSIIESVTRGVPIIGLPIFADQKLNSRTAEQMGYGLTIDYKNVSIKSLKWAVNEIIMNQKYAKNAKYYSKVLKDEIVPKNHLINYWINYMVHHNGAPFLQSGGKNIPLYQYLLLDLALFVLITIVLICYTVKILFNYVFKRCSHKKNIVTRVNKWKIN